MKLEKIEIDYNTLISITILQNTMENQNQTQKMQMIQINGQNAYYIYNGEKYAPTFPLELAKNFKEGCGPVMCENCDCYGRWNGVMIGLCANCAFYDYNLEYGPGFISLGFEFTDNPYWTNRITAFETYLKDVALDNIGDKNICDSFLQILEEEEEEEEQRENEFEDPYWSRYDNCPDEYGITGGSGSYSSSFDCSAGYDSY